MRESLTVEQFIFSGLSCHELKLYVQFSHQNTLDCAISLAVEFESFEGSQNVPGKPHDAKKPHVSFARALHIKNDNNSHINSKNLEESIQ